MNVKARAKDSDTILRNLFIFPLKKLQQLVNKNTSEHLIFFQCLDFKYEDDSPAQAKARDYGQGGPPVLKDRLIFCPEFRNQDGGSPEEPCNKREFFTDQTAVERRKPDLHSIEYGESREEPFGGIFVLTFIQQGRQS